MRVPVVLIPSLIIFLTVLGLNGTRFFRVPSAEMNFLPEPTGLETSRSVFIIDGVSCRDTALTAMGTLAETKGIYKAVAYASYNRIDVVHDAHKLSTAEICEAFQNPVYVEETGEFVFNMFKVLSINGQSIEAVASENKEESK